MQKPIDGGFVHDDDDRQRQTETIMRGARLLWLVLVLMGLLFVLGAIALDIAALVLQKWVRWDFAAASGFSSTSRGLFSSCSVKPLRRGGAQRVSAGSIAASFQDADFVQHQIVHLAFTSIIDAAVCALSMEVLQENQTVKGKIKHKIIFFRCK
ncbi:unnamed protein product [Dibothriocephalus latus]|uniref:Uncharacterized protein n=1 Tax=Dibothriocephalus latus TaxID=60516 RepID=A0A3P7LHS2_DIBLA|nr:unnamed protein product [Dibothriocephalus latus]